VDAFVEIIVVSIVTIYVQNLRGKNKMDKKMIEEAMNILLFFICVGLMCTFYVYKAYAMSLVFGFASVMWVLYTVTHGFLFDEEIKK